MRRKSLSRFVVGLVGISLGIQCTSAEVTYRLDFSGTWSAATHPGAFPGGAHFTELVGGVHNAAVNFWEMGEVASSGIESVAEVGGTFTFLNEVQAAINAGTAASKIFGPEIFGLPSSDSTMFSVEVSHPLVTLASMIAPSPDWFVGVSGLSLRENDQWLGRVKIDLLAYDAGTEEGMSFSLSNPATSPQEPITKVTTGPLAGLPPLGTITFTIQPNGLPGDFDLNGQVDGDDLLLWESGVGNFLDGMATVVDGDGNEDGQVDGADFLLWQQNMGTTLSGENTVATVPEPGVAALFLVGWIISMARRLRSSSPSILVG